MTTSQEKATKMRVLHLFVVTLWFHLTGATEELNEETFKAFIDSRKNGMIKFFQPVGSRKHDNGFLTAKRSWKGPLSTSSTILFF